MFFIGMFAQDIGILAFNARDDIMCHQMLQSPIYSHWGNRITRMFANQRDKIIGCQRLLFFCQNSQNG